MQYPRAGWAKWFEEMQYEAKSDVNVRYYRETPDQALKYGIRPENGIQRIARKVAFIRFIKYWEDWVGKIMREDAGTTSPPSLTGILSGAIDVWCRMKYAEMFTPHADRYKTS